jgi:hypothetical protein
MAEKRLRPLTEGIEKKNLKLSPPLKKQAPPPPPPKKESKK